MTRRMCARSGRTAGLVFVFAVIVASIQARSMAATPGVARSPIVRLTGSPKVAPDRKARANRLSNQKNGSVVVKLNGVLETLSKADREDQGHRVAAMNEIGLAILHMTPHKPGSKLPNPAEVYMSTEKAPGEDKEASTAGKTGSNGYVREALKELTAIQTHLSIMATTQEQIRASGSIKKAIHELNLALGSP